MSSRLSNMFEGNNNEIKVSELQCVQISSIDINSVKELARKLTLKFLFLLILMFLSSIFVSYGLYDIIKTSTEKFNTQIIFLLLLDLSFFWCIYYVFTQMLSTINSNYKKAQYGIVKNKYSVRFTAESSSEKEHYINALFPDTNTQIQRVICTNKIFKSLEEGTPVLIVSFDNKNAYAVPSNSK